MAESSKNGIFGFDQFRLDGGKLMLYRDGSELSIPPKVVKTLLVLVEGAGTIISKEEVIERVWDDAVVEESNLTQYLYLLRKVLGSMPDGRPYIETLRRRGYRFNGEVELLQEEAPAPKVASSSRAERATTSFSGVEREGNVLRLVDWKTSENHPSESVPSPLEQAATVPAESEHAAASGPPAGRSILPKLAVAAGALLLVALGGIFLWPRLMPAATNAESQMELSVVKLTNGPTPTAATISPDGNVFTYHEVDGEISRMYVQQTGQASRVEIASTSDKLFSSKTFSPDGQSIYYIEIEKKTNIPTLFRVPTMGGAAVRILDQVHGPITFSPDGNEFAFQRTNRDTGDSSIVIAGKDGRAEREVLRRKAPQTAVWSVAWSPDGKLIAFGEHTVEKGKPHGAARLHVVEVSTGRVTPVSAEKWDNILRMMWRLDGSGIILVGTRENDGYSTRRDQVYFVAYPSGVSKRVSMEGDRHENDSLGVTRKGEILAVPSNRSAQVWVMPPDGNASQAVQLTKGAADGRAGLGPLPNGKLGYLIRNAEEIGLMVANGDGTEPRQLATGLQFVEELRADPMGRFFVFSSMKDGKNHIFRLDIDSGRVMQLTFTDRAIDSTISPDGKFLVYDSGVLENNLQTYSLVRISTDGGDPTVLKPRGCFLPTYSPDGSMLSCVDNDKRGIVVISATDGTELERHPLPLSATWNFGIGWTPDGSGLIYIVTEKGTSNLFVQPRDGGQSKKLTNFSSGTIYRYAFAPDGTRLYVARGYPTQDVILFRNFR